MAIKKHIGKISNTGTNVIIVFRELPEDKDHCLVVEPARLPDMYHDGIMNMVDSKEAQQTNDFFEVLNRRQFGDGQHALTVLHTRQFMRKVPVDQVNMEPMPGRPVPLRMINDQIAGRVTSEKINSADSNNEPAVVNEVSHAKSLLAQAELLESEAKRKREAAYEILPELRPVVAPAKAGRPELTETQAASAKIEKTEKRRDYEKSVTQKKNAQAKADAIQEAVDAKILRDAERLDNTPL